MTAGKLDTRLPSLVPGVASISLLGLIGRQLFCYREIALLAAAAYGLSLTMIDIFCDVRATRSPCSSHCRCHLALGGNPTH